MKERPESVKLLARSQSTQSGATKRCYCLFVCFFSEEASPSMPRETVALPIVEAEHKEAPRGKTELRTETPSQAHTIVNLKIFHYQI